MVLVFEGISTRQSSLCSRQGSIDGLAQHVGEQQSRMHAWDSKELPCLQACGSRTPRSLALTSGNFLEAGI